MRPLSAVALFASTLLGPAQAAPSAHFPSTHQTRTPGVPRCDAATFSPVLAKFGGSLAPGSPYDYTNEPYGNSSILGFAAIINITDICGVRVAVTGNVAFEMYLPSLARWNRRFLTVGNSGFMGTTSRTDLFGRAVHGWAVMSTNTGHEDFSGNLTWGAGNQSLQIDWAWRAMASSVPFAKEMVAAYYENVTTVKNYYSGCSTGGRQGIRQTEVDPNSFDGMLLGAPAWNVRSAMPVISRIGWLGQTYDLKVGADSTLLPRIYNLVNQKCNVLGFDNTADDGVIRDSAACLRLFQDSGITGPVWSGLDCQNNVPTPNCISLPQREAFMTILEEFKVPPQNQTYAGDGFDITSVNEWFTFLVESSLMDFDQQFSKYFLSNVNETIVWDSDANGERLIARSNDWDVQVRANANPAVLNGWRGKTILYTGTADGVVSSHGTRRAFDMAGGAGNTNLAFFELPGMPHCYYNSGLIFGGNNPHWYIGAVGLAAVSTQWYMPNDTIPRLNNAEHDALIALTEWVEGSGSKPTQLTATAFSVFQAPNNITISKQRPICAVPMRQDYVGGDVNDKGSWMCVPE